MNSKEKFILRALIRWNKKEFIKKNCFSLKLIQQSSKIDNDELNYTISEFVIPPVKVDKCIFDVIPSSFQTMNSTQDFMTALRLVYRNKYLESERNNIITHGFRLVKQLNSISIALKNMYEKHSQHKDPIINKKALLKIGQVCEHIVHGYRGVVVGWTIDEATSQQEVTLLLDTSDYSEFLDSLMTVDHEKLRRLSLSEARLVSDDDLLRISNAALFSGYFTKFDLSLKRYIPKKELQFCFPMDFKDNSEQKRRNGRFMNAKRSTSKDQLNKQESLEEVRKSLLALCKDLLDIIRLYPISQSLLDLSLEESREGEITEIDRVTFPAVAETILDLTSIVGHLQTKDIASSYRGSIAKIPLWGPKVYGSKSVRQINPGPDLATLVYEACEMLSITYKHLEKTLQFRLQQHGIGHIDDLLSVYSPTSGTARRTIDFELEYASALRSEKELNEVISVPISKTSRPAGKSNFAVISAVPEGLEIVDTTVTPPVHFSVGQVVLHKMYGYRAVIYGYDQRPTRDVSNWSGVKNLVHRDNQPFYWVFPDEDDLQKSWGSNQMYPNLYAAQENLQLMTPSSSCPVRNRYIKSYFGGYNATSGEFDLKGSKLRFQFPRALASPPMTEGTVNNSIPPPQQVNELHAGDAVAQNLLLHLLAAMKRSFNESRIGGVNHQLIDNFPRLRKINKLSSSGKY